MSKKSSNLQKIEFNGKVYFTFNELKCKGSGVVRMAEGFPEHLLALRIAWGRPMSPTSASRSTAHNAKVGGGEYSYHIYDDERGGSSAIDIRINNAKDRADLISLALDLGWSVGVHGVFVHLDRRDMFGEEQLVFPY